MSLIRHLEQISIVFSVQTHMTGIMPFVSPYNLVKPLRCATHTMVTIFHASKLKLHWLRLNEQPIQVSIIMIWKSQRHGAEILILKWNAYIVILLRTLLKREWNMFLMDRYSPQYQDNWSCYLWLCAPMEETRPLRTSISVSMDISGWICSSRYRR